MIPISLAASIALKLKEDFNEAVEHALWLSPI
jgi:hypothetical protein